MKKIILLFILFCAMLVNAQSPLSKFAATVSGANTITFSNESTGNPTSFNWEFVGGSPATSTSPNPSVSYTGTGVFTVKLTVNNASGSSVSTRTIKVTQGNIIDLSTGRNDDGTLMAIGTTDYDWKCELPNGTIVIPFTRSTYGQWSYAQIITGVKNSVWITGNDIGTGYYTYTSKTFVVPADVLDAKLNLRSLSFVKGWTYLLKENTDGTENETLITQTTGTGWYNSGNALVSDLHLDPGSYRLKVKVYDNNSSVTEATDVNANVNFGNTIIISPIAEFYATPTNTNVGSAVQFTNLSQGTPSSVLWGFEDGSNILTSTQNNPNVTFSTSGNHHTELLADYGSGLLSSLKINNYIQTTQLNAPIVAVTQPTCNLSTGSITVTSPITGVTYSFDNGVTFQSTNSVSGLVSGTYLVRVKNAQGAISNAVSAVINPAFPTEILLSTTQSSCTSNTGSITITSPSSGVEYSFDGGITYQISNTKSNLATGVYQIAVRNNECTLTRTAVICDAGCQGKDFTKAPNSYIFDPKQDNSGFYIPVTKAYAMWRDQNGLLNDNTVLNGTPTAEVYWEDVSGLIRSTNYSLPLIGEGECARIKVEIDKAKGEGNAVVALKINNKIIWSWHVWVTDDPTGGVTYGHVRAGAETASYVENGVTKTFTPKWMDRNLGATNKDFIGYNWDKSSGLMYQWGRKDPFPAFANKDASMFEVSGMVGVKKHLLDYTGDNSSNRITSMQRPFNDINSNIKYAVNNPLDLIFINTVGGDAWFAQNIGTDDVTRKKSDLWGDNSELRYSTGGEVNTYKPKTAYDPCPNNWRMPSYINNVFANTVTNSSSPWGRTSGSPANDFASYANIKPTAANAALMGIKIYANLGMDFTNTTINGTIPRNMGVYPGNGKYVVGSTGDFYHQDPHEIVIHSATIASTTVTSQGTVNNPYFYYLNGIPDSGQFYSKPDPTNPTYSNMIGRYYLFTQEHQAISGANACRCIEDKYAATYNFPTQYFTTSTLVNYTEGITEPNSHRITAATAQQEIKIPISKAFAVYNQYLSDHGMLDFSNLKANVYWTDNRSLISNVKIINPPTNVNNIKDAYISVTVAGDQPGSVRNTGNAVVSLHNGSVSNPAYWSWHVWVTSTDVSEISYQTEDVLLPSTSNYVNFTNSGSQPMKSTFMDRNLGATDVFPDVVNPESVTAEELAMINHSAGMQYQWGRKDPIPSFINPGIVLSNGVEKTGEYSIWTSSGPDANGNIYPSSFTELTGNTYENTYVKRRDIDYGTVGINKAEKMMNNLKYSAENPLAYMVPNQKYTNRSAINVLYDQDWLYSEPNQMMDRWGHATTKSVFDPCPGGYRVPDISFGIFDNDPNDPNHNDDNKGSSPWYNGFFMPTSSTDKFKLHNLGIVQDLGFDIKNPSDIYNGGVPYYLGSVVKSSNTVFGYQFNSLADSANPNTNYNIGNYPATGFRGYDGNNYTNGISSSMKLGISGLWTAALKSLNSYGTAHSMSFETTNANSSKLVAMNEFFVNHPMNAMNVRCVKEEPRFGQPLGTASNMGKTTANKTTQKTDLDNVIANQNNDIEVYPNPVKNSLYIKSTETMTYKIYDAGGRLLNEGQTLNSRIDCSTLVKGLYILKLNGKKGMVTKKLVKE